MPLQKGPNAAAFSHNVAAEMRAGKPQRQAVAIAYKQAGEDEEPIVAAGILFITPDGKVLLLRRSSKEENFAGHWAIPGGKGEPGETPEEAADREATEEIGSHPPGRKILFDRRTTPNGFAYSTYVKRVDSAFDPKLNDEHDGHQWASLDDLPHPLHPAVQDNLRRLKEVATKRAEDEKGCDFFDRLTTALFMARSAAADSIAFDKASVRTVDENGHMRVERSPISRAVVSPYYGREIPEWKKLGLDPDRVYNLYRDADELKKAAPTFAGKPLLLRHTPSVAEDHPRQTTVGSVGDDVEFEGDTLFAPLNIWDQEAIDAIENETLRDLSCGYLYDCDMTPGVAPDGTPYDGRMINIRGNHLAQVEEGRVPGAYVADAAPGFKTQPEKNGMKKPLSLKAAQTQGAVFAYLRPLLAADAKIDLTPIFAGVTSKNFESRTGKMLHDIKKAVAGKLAADAVYDNEGLKELLGAVGAHKAEDEEEGVRPNLSERREGPDDTDAVDDDPFAKINALLKGKLSDEEMAALGELLKQIGAATEHHERSEMAGQDEDREDQGAMRREGGRADDENEEDKLMNKAAMDAAINKAVSARVAREIGNAVAVATKKLQDNFSAIRDAEREVEPYVGKLAMSFDSAENVRRAALDVLGVDHADVHPSALSAILKAQPLPGHQPAPSRGSAKGYASADAELTKILGGLEPVRVL
jgi:hypothetical protein